MITLNDLIKFAKLNNLDFDAPIRSVKGAAVESMEQVGEWNGSLALIPPAYAYDASLFETCHITGVVNTMKYFDMEGKVIPEEEL